MTNVLALPTGTELVGDFRIERVLGAGGFGITYLAEEIALARLVTIKEYFPSDFAARGEALAAIPRDADAQADFQWGLDRFIDEAQTLARFDHRNIVKVYRYFQANGTAYMVLHFEEGQSLKAWLRSLNRVPRQRELDEIVGPLLDALEVIHAADFLHRDIAPDNIIIRKDRSPVLIDFGSARGDIARHSRTVSALVKPGYSPYEQYAENGVRQGPWTDIYALAATLYHAIAGKRPPDSPSRVVADDLVPARQAALAGYRQTFLAAIDRALALDTSRRPQSIPAWRGDLLAPDPAKPGWFQRVTSRPAASGAQVKTRPLTQQPGNAPPAPDAPGAKGGLLDYIDGLKKNDAPASPMRAQPPPADAKAIAEASEKPSRPSASRAATKSAPKEFLPVPAPKKTAPPRPRAVRAGGSSWRSFAVKFLIGAGIAGAAIAMQDRLPNTVASRSAAPSMKPSMVPSTMPGATPIAKNPTITASIPRAAPRTSMLSGHTGGTVAVGFTEDGRTIVTTGADAAVKIWNAANGTLLRTIPIEDGPAVMLAVKGRRALTGNADGRIDLWDIDTGAKLGRFKRNDTPVLSLAFTQDQNQFAASSSDGSVAIWDTRTEQTPFAVIEAHDTAVEAVAYSGRGPWIATGSADKTVSLWRAGNFNEVRTYKGHRENVTSLAFSPDGRYLAAAAQDGRIRVWTTSSNGLYRLNSAHKGRIAGIAFSPDGDVIASAGEDGSVQLWQFKQSRSIRALAEQGIPAKALAFAPDGSRIVVAGAEGAIRFWDAATPQRQR